MTPLDPIAEAPPAASARSSVLSSLVEHIERGDGPVAILSGPAGSGKSWLARAALDRVASVTLVGTGKYGEGDGQAALDPVMAALSHLVAAALRRLYDTQTGIASLTDALGVDLEILLSAGLTVAGLDPRGTIAALGDKRTGSARIIAAALALLRWLDRFDVRLAILIDDWRRAPAEAVDLIRALAIDRAARRGGQSLAILLTQREPAASDAIGGGVVPLTFRLGTLDEAEVLALLAERLGGVARAEAVIDTLGAAMPCLPFDVLQVADGFASSGALEQVGGHWRVDPARAGGLAFDAAQRVAALDDGSRRTARALALWGDSAPAPVLLAALDLPSDATATLQAQGIVAAGGERISFRHDRLRQAVLDHACAEQRRDLSAWLAERLPPSAPDSESEIAALNLRLGGGIDDVEPVWRDRFARGARSARRRGDAAAAGRFAEAALALHAPLPDPESDRLVLHEAVLAAADRDDPATEARARALIATARSVDERSEDYAVGAVALRFAGQTEGAWRLACQGLRSVRILPPIPGSRLQLWRAALRWWVRRPARIAPASPSDARPLDGFSGIAAAAASIGYHRDPRAAAVIGFQASRLARRETHGSAYWQSVDAFLFAALGDRAGAAAAGHRALACFDQQRVYRAASLYQAIFFGVHWAEPLARHRDRFREITRIALGEGDAVTASYGWRIFIMSGWRSGASLGTLCDEAIEARNALRILGEGSFVEEIEAVVALLEGMTGRAPWDSAAWRMDIATRNHVIDLELANLAGDWGETVRRAALLVPLRRDYAIQVDSVVLRFHETLARLRCGMRARRRDLRFLARAAAMNPYDHAPKLRLIEAERMRVRGGPRVALPLYAEAVALAVAADSRLDAALTLRCAGDAAREAGEAALAHAYHARSMAILADSGAVAGARVEPLAAIPEAIAAAELRAAAAERADRAKTRLLAHAGHELRTPLQALQTLLDLDAEGTATGDEARSILGSLKGVVDDLNLLSDLADDRAELACGVDLADLMRSEIALWSGAADIALDLARESGRVDVAADRVRQVLRNLLSNAVKYGAGPITVTLAEAADTATVTVADSGRGVPEHAIDQLFAPFERGAFEGDGRGVGLGLALSRRIAERLGGTLTAGNRAEGGAVFTFTFTFTAHSAQVTARNTTVRPAAILLVEDSAPIRRLLAAILSRAGHATTQAATAAEALAAFVPGAFDLAIVDLGLPDADGLDLVAAIRARASGFPVILLTASCSGAADAAAVGGAQIRVLRKPASAQAIAATIAELLDTAPPDTDWSAATSELAPLYGAARVEIVAQAERIAAAPAEATPAQLHELAGLAAQFGWPATARAVEGLGAAIVTGATLDEWPARILETLSFV